MISKCQSKRTLLQRKYLESQGIPWLSCYSWEQRKLGECFSERVESDPNGELISVTIGSGIKKFSELGRRKTRGDTSI